MLVLTRKPDESIHIGDDIRITVLSVRGDRVRIGISAPGDVSIKRKEIVFNNSYSSEVETHDHHELARSH